MGWGELGRGEGLWAVVSSLRLEAVRLRLGWNYFGRGEVYIGK